MCLEVLRSRTPPLSIPAPPDVTMWSALDRPMGPGLAIEPCIHAVRTALPGSIADAPVRVSCARPTRWIRPRRQRRTTADTVTHDRATGSRQLEDVAGPSAVESRTRVARSTECDGAPRSIPGDVSSDVHAGVDEPATGSPRGRPASRTRSTRRAHCTPVDPIDTTMCRCAERKDPVPCRARTARASRRAADRVGRSRHRTRPPSAATRSSVGDRAAKSIRVRRVAVEERVDLRLPRAVVARGTYSDQNLAAHAHLLPAGSGASGRPDPAAERSLAAGRFAVERRGGRAWRSDAPIGRDHQRTTAAGRLPAAPAAT